MRGRVWVGFAVLGLLAASTWASQRVTPRFIFRAGDAYSYRIEYHTRAQQSEGEARQDLVGQADFRVLKLNADGSATVELTTQGAGQVMASGSQLTLKDPGPARVHLIVRPDGTIVTMRTPEGKPTTFLADVSDLFAGSYQVRAFVAVTYTLFGLQLPAALPAAGGLWTGSHKTEYSTTSPVKLDSIKFQLTPVTYRYLGAQDYQGSACLAVSYPLRVGQGQETAPCVVYFDPAAGRVVGLEVHYASGSSTAELTATLLAP